MMKRYKVTVTFTFDASNLALAQLIVVQGKSIIIGEWTKRAAQSEVASLIQELRPEVSYDGPEEIL